MKQKNEFNLSTFRIICSFYLARATVRSYCPSVAVFRIFYFGIHWVNTAAIGDIIFEVDISYTIMLYFTRKLFFDTLTKILKPTTHEKSLQQCIQYIPSSYLCKNWIIHTDSDSNMSIINCTAIQNNIVLSYNN